MKFTPAEWLSGITRPFALKRVSVIKLPNDKLLWDKLMSSKYHQVDVHSTKTVKEGRGKSDFSKILAQEIAMCQLKIEV